MLGDRIKELRKEKGLTQIEFSKVIGLSASTIAMLETNRRELSNSMLIKFADYFDVTIDYLLGRSEYKKGRILTKDEMNTFLPKELSEMPDLQIAVDDKEQRLSEDTKKEIIEVLKKNGYIK